MTELLIIGAGGFARETAAMVRADLPEWNLLGLLDDDVRLHGDVRGGVAVLGSSELVADHPDAAAVICVGSPSNFLSRRRVVERLGLPADRYATIVHPSVVRTESVRIGVGSIVHAGCVLTADVEVGAHVAVMPHVVLTHDDVVGAYVTFGSGALVAGGVQIGNGAYIGAGARIRENLGIGAWALVGMGSVVTRDVPSCEVWAGVPARHTNAIEVPVGWIE